MRKETGSRLPVVNYLFPSIPSFIWPVNHSTPCTRKWKYEEEENSFGVGGWGWKSVESKQIRSIILNLPFQCLPTSLSPSPVTALLAQMCHGLSINLSSPRVCDTFTLDIASLQSRVKHSVELESHLLSILLAKKRMGSRLAWMSGCCKKLQSHLVHFRLRPTPGLPFSIPIVYTTTRIITWSNMSNSSFATTILSRSLESTTKMMPWSKVYWDRSKKWWWPPDSPCSSAPTSFCTFLGRTCRRQWSPRSCLRRDW